jgi:D-sedoheptulose 7-phosphate isomerase
MHDKIKKIITDSIVVKSTILADTQMLDRIQQIAVQMVKSLKNNGSAADAQHLAAEFSGRFYTDRQALPAEALHCNTSYLTAVANDYGFDVVYARLIQGIANAGDFVVGLSTSGNSINIVKAFEAAREKNIITVGFTGKDG